MTHELLIFAFMWSGLVVCAYYMFFAFESWASSKKEKGNSTCSFPHMPKLPCEGSHKIMASSEIHRLLGCAFDMRLWKFASASTYSWNLSPVSIDYSLLQIAFKNIKSKTEIRAHSSISGVKMAFKLTNYDKHFQIQTYKMLPPHSTI